MGTSSDAGCFSLSIAKLLPTGQGGFVTTKDKNTYEQLKRIRTQGVDDLINCTFYQMGFNFRFTDLQAAIGCAQLKCIQEKIAYVKEVYQKYEEALKQLTEQGLIDTEQADEAASMTKDDGDTAADQGGGGGGARPADDA